MKILKELLGLTDPNMVFEAEVPVELRDVIAAFPKHHEKAFQKMWGGKRLVWHGKRFFDDGDLGPAYNEAEKAAKALIVDGSSNTDTNLDISGEVDGEEYNDTLSIDITFNDGETQECYLGYDAKRDVLFIGFDVWADDVDEEFEKTFNSTFNDMTGGVDYDSEEPEHEKIYDKAWEEYQNSDFKMWGMVFEISMQGSEMVAEEALAAMPGGFYKDMFKIFKRQNPNVVHLRLD